jgi:hypothetical protein
VKGCLPAVFATGQDYFIEALAKPVLAGVIHARARKGRENRGRIEPASGWAAQFRAARIKEFPGSRWNNACAASRITALHREMELAFRVALASRDMSISRHALSKFSHTALIVLGNPKHNPKHNWSVIDAHGGAGDVSN